MCPGNEACTTHRKARNPKVCQARIDCRPARTVVDRPEDATTVSSSDERGAQDSKGSDIVIRQPRVGGRPANAVVRRKRDSAGARAPDKEVGAAHQKSETLTGRQAGRDPVEATVCRSKDPAAVGGGKDVAHAGSKSIDIPIR